MKNLIKLGTLGSFKLLKFDLKMKLTTLLLIISLSQLQANLSFGQDVKVTLNLKGVELEKVLDKIESQTNFKFMYNDNELDYDRIVSIKAKREKLSSVLNRIFRGSNIDFNILETQIILRSRIDSEQDQEASVPDTISQLEISGTVTDKNGTPLPGASIIEKGTSNGTQSDFDGNFSLVTANENAVLVISYLGFVSQEISLNGRTSFTIVLQEDTAALDEVVVVGYGTQKKVNLTGAVTAVSSDDIDDRPATDVTNLLTGIAPGITVRQNNGQPGSDSGILNIRGIGTFGDTSPLVIVDGVESSLSNIDPNEIENVSILKDAASASIYGVRAANGVILITTKRGKSGKLKINYNGYAGFQNVTELPQFLGSADFARVLNEARANDGLAPQFTDSEIQQFESGGNPLFPNNNQLELLFSESGFQQNQHLSVAGGGETTKYNFSFGYLNREGLLPNTGYDRYSVRLNLDQKITEKLTLGVNISGTQEIILNPAAGVGGVVRQAMRQWPTTVIRYPNGNWGSFLTDGNAIAHAREGGVRTDKLHQLLSTFTAEYEIVDGLKVKGIASTTFNFNKRKTFNRFLELFASPDDAAAPSGTLRSGLEERRIERNLNNLQGLVTYDKTFGNHNLGFLLGVQQISETEEEIRGSINDLPSNNQLDQLSAGDDSTDGVFGSGFQFRSRSVFGRLNYSFKDKYLFEANFRRDGTSRFPKSNRFEVFPSFSVGWNIAKEDFFDVPAVQNLKLRGSWGKLGNQEIGNYGFLSTYTIGSNYSFGGSLQTGVSESNPLPNDAIKWEVTTITNIGLDVDILSGKLGLSFEYFKKDTDDILLNLAEPLILGGNPPIQNAGGIENKGFELTLRHRNTIGGFNYYANANLTVVKNKVTSLGDREVSDSPGVFGVGDSIGDFFGLEVVGIFQSQAEVDAAANQDATGGAGPGDLQYRDINGRDAQGNLTGTPDGIINNDDRVTLGNPFPELNYGLQLGGDYKNFDFSVLLQGTGNVTGYLSREAAEPFFNGGKALVRHQDAWSPSNTDASYPRLSIANANRNNQISSFFAQDASYLKMRNIQIGYSLPNSVLDKIGLEKFRFYLSADNVFTITNFDGFDPEAPNFDSDGFNQLGRVAFYPQVRTFTFGINLSL